MRSNNRILMRLLIAAMMLVGLTLQTGMVYAEGEAKETVTPSQLIAFTPDTTNQNIENAWGPGAATIEEEDGAYKVTLLKNITYTNANGPIVFGNYNHPQGKDQPRMILDLNGCTVTSNTTTIINYGNLTIKDSTGEGKVIMSNSDGNSPAVQNGGYELIVEGGTFDSKAASWATNNSAVFAAATTTTIIRGGVFKGNKNGALITIGNAEISGGTFYGKYGVVSKIAGDRKGSITFVEGSTSVVSSENAPFLVHGDRNDTTKHATINVNGGTFHTNGTSNVAISGAFNDEDAMTITGGIYDVSPLAYVADETAAANCEDAQTSKTRYAVGQRDITRMANEASDESVLDVVQGSVELTGLDNVTIQNSGNGTVSVNGITVTEEPVEVHTVELVKGQQPTCTEAGWSDYYRCTGDDGKLFSDAQAQNEITMDIEEWKRTEGRLDVIAHNLELQKGQAPTCTEAGWNDYYSCTNEVGRYFEDAEAKKEIADLEAWKLGEGALEVTKHNLELQKGQAPTCTEAGWNDYYMCKDEVGRYFEDAEAKKEITDLAAWKLGTGALGVVEHTYEWVIDKEATTTETGLKHEECKVCGEAKEAVVIPLKPTKPSIPTDIPETGDASGVIPWVILLVLAGAGLAYASIANQKKKEDE